jgi:hypothetical protein
MKFKDSVFGEIGVRVQKALTTHTYAYVSLGAILPQNAQVFGIGTGVTF